MCDMRYWRHNNNGRVGKHPTKPSQYWHEITREQYANEKALQDALLKG